MEKKHLIYTESQMQYGTAVQKPNYAKAKFHRIHAFIDDEELEMYNKYFSYSFVNTRKVFTQPVESIFLNSSFTCELGHLVVSLN